MKRDHKDAWTIEATFIALDPIPYDVETEEPLYGDYFYDKYALIIDYEEVPETVEIPEKSYTVYTDNVIEENLSNKGITMTYDQGLYYQYKFKSSYSVQVRRKYTDTIKIICSYYLVIRMEKLFLLILIYTEKLVIMR